MRLGGIALALLMVTAVPAVAQENGTAGTAGTAVKASAPSIALTRGQVSRLKGWLHLSADQEQHWRPVEVVLHEIADNSARGSVDRGAVHKLAAAAGPLLATMSTMQRQVAMRFARLVGVQQDAMNF